MNMRKKPRVNFEKYFVKADRGALRLLQRMLAFDPVERPTCEEALAGRHFCVRLTVSLSNTPVNKALSVSARLIASCCMSSSPAVENPYQVCHSSFFFI